MEQVIAYKNSDGDVAILFPFEGARRKVVVKPASFTRIESMETEASPKRFDVGVIVAETRAETDDEFLAWVGAKDVPSGVIYKIADASTVPADDSALGAWFTGLGKKSGTGIGQEAWCAAEDQAAAARESELQVEHDALSAQINSENSALMAEWIVRRAVESQAAVGEREDLAGSQVSGISDDQIILQSDKSGDPE